MDLLKQFKKMSSGSKDDRKVALDVSAWMFNIVTSVGIIMVNKILMATYGFTFGMLVSLSMDRSPMVNYVVTFID